MATPKKPKKLTAQQKLDVYYAIDNEGQEYAVAEGYLDEAVKGTALAAAVKDYKKAVKAFDKAKKKAGVPEPGDTEKLDALQEVVDAEEDQKDGDEGDDGTF